MDKLSELLDFEVESTAFDAVYRDDSKTNKKVESQLMKPKLYVLSDKEEEVPIPLSVGTLCHSLLAATRLFSTDFQNMVAGLVDHFGEFKQSPEFEFLYHWASYNRIRLQSITQTKKETEIIGFLMADMVNFYEETQPAVLHNIKGIHMNMSVPNQPSSFNVEPIFHGDEPEQEEEELAMEQIIAGDTGGGGSPGAGSPDTDIAASGLLKARTTRKDSLNSPRLQQFKRSNSVARLSLIQSQKAMEDLRGLRAQLANHPPPGEANKESKQNNNEQTDNVLDESARVETETEEDIYKSILAEAAADSPSSKTMAPSKPRRAAPKRPQRAAPSLAKSTSQDNEAEGKQSTEEPRSSEDTPSTPQANTEETTTTSTATTEGEN